MKPEECEGLEQRIEKFKAAKRKIERLRKISDTIAAIFGNAEHTIGTIVVDINRREFRYQPDNDQGAICRICSLDDDDQAELFDEFFEWAINSITQRISDQAEAMDDA